MQDTDPPGGDPPGLPGLPGPSDPPGADPGGGVLRLIAHKALLAGLCQFVPVPFVDDLLGDRVRRSMVGQLLQRRGRSFDAPAVKPLYAGPPKSGLSRVTGFAKSLVFQPVKKLLRTVFLVVTVRRAVLGVAGTLLLGRSLDRRLAAGHFADGTPEEGLRAEAAALEAAVRGALASPERRGLVRLVRASFRALRQEGVDPAPAPGALEAAGGDPEQALSPGQRRRLASASGRLGEALEREAGGGLLAGLDAAVDARLA